jgi:hypothetical protein
MWGDSVLPICHPEEYHQTLNKDFIFKSLKVVLISFLCFSNILSSFYLVQRLQKDLGHLSKNLVSLFFLMIYLSKIIIKQIKKNDTNNNKIIFKEITLHWRIKEQT